MSRLIARILLSIFVFPLAGLVYLVAFFLLEHYYRGRMMYRSDRSTTCFLISGIIMWGFMVLYWTLLWRRSVRWDGVRLLRTALGTVAAIIIGVGAGQVCAPVDTSFGVFIGSISVPLLWLVGTIFAWGETAAERGARVTASTSAVVCPTCGYNLTGLRDLRCPECGTQFTLDQLMAAQPGKAERAELGE